MRILDKKKSFSNKKFTRKKITIISKKARASYIVCINNKYYFLKTEPPVGKLINKISRFISQGSIPFKNEIRINKFITENNLMNFPKIVDTDSKNYLLFENLTEGQYKITDLSEEKITELLLCIQDINYTDNIKLLEKVMKFLILNPTLKIFRSVIHSKELQINKLTIKTLLLFSKLSFEVKKLNQSFFIHGDLDYNNILITENKDPYIIDFEDSILEKKWILIDVVDLTFDRTELELNFDIINEYLKEMNLNDIFNNKNIKTNQLHYAVARRVLLLINSNKTDKNKKSKYIDFFEEIILNDKAFNKWLTQQVGF